jgi:hypothetical protein
MPKKRYQVTFSGNLVSGLDKKDILANLSALFKKDPERIRATFKGSGALVAQCDSREQAARYVDAIRRAGAICEVREQALPAHGAPDGSTAPSPSVSPDQELGGPKIIESEAGPTDITLAPLGCSRIGGTDGGLLTNRSGRESIAFDRLALICAFKSSESRNEINLLVFTHGDRRPLLADASAIAFADFPDVVGINLLSSLRNFLAFVLRKNPALVLDRGTAQFIAGEAPFLFTGQTVSLVSDLARAFAQSAPHRATLAGDDPRKIG